MSDRVCEPIIAITASAGALWGGVNFILGTADASSWMDIFERGGFLLVTLLGIALFVWLVVPKMLDFGKDYLNGLHEANEKNIAYFLAELKEERATRERTEEAFRTSLHETKTETVAAIKEQTEYTAALVKELKDRPCQGLTFRPPITK